jgi:mono/diheme cytochrome c family protein
VKASIAANLLVSGLLAASLAQADTVDDLLAQYASEAAGPFRASAGEQLFHRQYDSADGAKRACTSCHTNDLRQPGRHAATGRGIEPLAPSVNTRRLTERDEMEKWLTRNCKWTLGRACTAQEKGDLLAFIRSQ